MGWTTATKEMGDQMTRTNDVTNMAHGDLQREVIRLRQENYALTELNKELRKLQQQQPAASSSSKPLSLIEWDDRLSGRKPLFNLREVE